MHNLQNSAKSLNMFFTMKLKVPAISEVTITVAYATTILENSLLSSVEKKGPQLLLTLPNSHTFLVAILLS